ncbi:hypothetical protein O181_036684 [Austropuccinia psidii MF-1]|uniref:Uncharacterized protein n=1 Tax=Austropuccinia psidii MF-1 TaxID=1389203 RepID=A0A9Q3D508_9BASI|nr:hypothetical protein [Austropuccinia psidii MF-1]
MTPVHLRELELPKNKPEERAGLFRSRGSGFGQNRECKDIQGDHAHTPINLPFQQKTQTRGLDKHGSSTSDPSNPQRTVPMENAKQDSQSTFTLGRIWGNLPEDMSQRDLFQRPYGKSQILESQQ